MYQHLADLYNSMNQYFPNDQHTVLQKQEKAYVLQMHILHRQKICSKCKTDQFILM